MDTETTTAPARHGVLNALPFYRGWTVVAAGFVCAMLAVGGTVYTFGTVVTSIAQEFNLSRGQVNNGYALMLLGMALWSPLVGWLLDRVPARAIMGVGAAAFAGGLTMIALASGPWMMGLAAIGPLGFGVASGGALAANTVTTRWFRRRRGLAMGILAVSSSTGGFLVAPLAARLVTMYDWRVALLTIGLGAGALIALCVLVFIRDRPSSVGLSVENEPVDVLGAPAAPDGEAWTIPKLVVNANFLFITAGCAILLACDQALIVSLVPYGTDMGFTLERAAAIIATLTASSIAGKLVVGLLADHVDKRILFAVVVACHIGFNITLLARPSYETLLLLAALMGLATGGVYPVWTTITAEVFGSRSFGSVMGAMALVMQPMAILFISLVGRSYDATQSYQQALIGFIALSALAATLIAFVRLPPKRPYEETASVFQ
jgi:MFS family permease